MIAKAGPKEQQRVINSHAKATGRETTQQIGLGIFENGHLVQAATTDVIEGVRPGKITPEIAASSYQAQTAVDNALRSVRAKVKINFEGGGGYF